MQQEAAHQTEGAFEAVVQFVDISGFTALTEELMTHGKEGAEELGQSLRFFFNPLIAAVQNAGRFITGFAGDAFTAVYPQKEVRDYSDSVLYAAQLMQDFFSENGVFETPFGSFSFAIKVGITFGKVEWGILEISDDFSTYFFRGTGNELISSIIVILYHYGISCIGNAAFHIFTQCEICISISLVSPFIH